MIPRLLYEPLEKDAVPLFSNDSGYRHRGVGWIRGEREACFVRRPLDRNGCELKPPTESIARVREIERRTISRPAHVEGDGRGSRRASMQVVIQIRCVWEWQVSHSERGETVVELALDAVLVYRCRPEEAGWRNRKAKVVNLSSS